MHKNTSISELTSLIAQRKIGVVETVKDYLQLIKDTNGKLNTFITVSGDLALQRAAALDNIVSKANKTGADLLAEYPLLGAPFSLKDIYSTKGIKTTAASRVLENYIPAYDSTVYKRLESAGAILLGKNNCDAWAHGSSGENSDFGATKNPYDNQRTPGGSSSGPAASVASGQVVFAMGSDTGGSVRLPASFCNIVGLKPTYGRVSRYGIIAMASSLDCMGPMTKTIEDSAKILSVIAGKDDSDASSSFEPVSDYLSSIDDGVNGMKIGIPKEFFGTGLSENIKEKVREGILLLEKQGAKIIEISLPNTKYALSVYYIIQPSEVSSNLARYDGVRFGNGRDAFGSEAKRRIMLGTYVLSAGYYDAYYLKAMKVRTLIKNDFENAFSKVDVIATPVATSLPFRIGEKIDNPLQMYLSDIYTITSNLAGVPAASVPAGFIKGLPVGLQLIGSHFREDLIFKIGKSFERETEYYKVSPKMS